MTDEPAIYSSQELELLNKYFLRNRLKMISRPVHAQYIRQLLLQWGGPKLLSKLQDNELNFKEELLNDCLREVKRFKELKRLGESLDLDVKGKARLLPEIMREAHIVEHFKSSEFKEAVDTLKTSFGQYFEKREYSKLNLGKLLSSLVERKRDSTKILKGLDQLLFPKTSEITITVKMLLLGKDDMLARLKQIE
jgi:hypothetical protein